MDVYRDRRVSWNRKNRHAIAVGAFILAIFFIIPYLQFAETGIIEGFFSRPHITIVPSRAYVQVEVEEDTGLWPYRVFKSSPWTPPNLEITRHRETVDLADGLLFFNPTNRSGACVKQSAPFIMSPVENELVYAFNESMGTSGVRVQDIDGQPHLTFWRGRSVLGHGFGEVVFLDHNYTEDVVNLDSSLDFVKNIPEKWHLPQSIDFHEQQTTSRGTILVTAYNNTPHDLSALGGPRDGWVFDCQFYEIDTETKQVVFSWSALQHISINGSQLPVETYMGNGSLAKPYDFFHINSVQEVSGNFLVSSRHMWAVYLVSGEDGHVIWEINGSGQGGDFGPLAEEAQFRWAHYARAHNVTAEGMEISLFDNHANQYDNGTMPSRGLVLGISLPPDPHTPPALLRDVQVSDSAIYSGSQGNYQAALSNGNQLIGYGPIPLVREFGPAWNGSELLWEGRFGFDLGAQNYRAYKFAWHATPLEWDPSLVVNIENDTLVGYVSWNGATEVDAWNIYIGNYQGENMEMTGKALKKGFETVFEIVASREACVQVAAAEAHKEIRLSNVVCLGGNQVSPEERED